MRWYALYVETGQEEVVRTLIRKQYDESAVYAIVPKRKLQERKQGRTYEVCKTMFPGYVLLKTKMNLKTYHYLNRLPKSYRLLNTYNPRMQEGREGSVLEWDLCSQIDNDEMELLLQLMGTDGIIGYSTVYVTSTNVVVCEGPLKGKEGHIKKIDMRKKRARISLVFNGHERCLDVGIEMLTAPEAAESLA
ncbi:antiterminator LoaP [Paenibacillus sp. S-38]|uniref:antiterminator LoaP n=1 Tax=Paenibacillus sp. S-38 TaxID=3416710 RepID=UPI003CF9F4C8